MGVVVEVRLYTTLRKKTGILKKFKTKASKVGGGGGGGGGD